MSWDVSWDALLLLPFAVVLWHLFNQGVDSWGGDFKREKSQKEKK